MSGLAEGGYVDGLEELVATRDQLEVILGNVSEGVTVASRDGRFVYANERAARAIGFETVEELLATSFDAARERFEVFHGDGRRMEPDELPARRAFSGEETGDVVVRFRPAGGGEERVSVVRAVPVLDAEGRVQLVISFFREVTEERRRAARESFIAEAGNLIGSTLDYESTLRAVASLAVPRLADWCLIDLVADDGSLQRVATEHADPAKEALSEELQRRWPWSLDDDVGAGRVIRSGRSELVPVVTDAMAVAVARDEEHLRVMREFGTTAALAVPIEARGRILGAISLGLTSSLRMFGAEDLELAEDLARRAGIAIDNAQLFRETRRSEALLDTLLETAPVGLGFVDRELRFVRVNEALADINGLPPEEHIGRPMSEVLPALDPEVYDAYRRVLETGVPVSDFESGGETPAQPGVRRTWVASYYPVHGPDGAVVGVGAVVTEVTERRRSEQRLALQHAVTRILAEADRVGDAAPRTLAAMCELLGWEVGVYWPIRGRDEATVAYVHAAPELQRFADAVRAHVASRGVGLVGEIWERGEPLWMPDLDTRTDFPVREVAAELGIRTGFGFPAVAGGGVVGVIEFFAREARRPDPELAEVVSALGRNIGQFVRRRRAEKETERVLVAEQQARAEAEAAATTLRKLGAVAEVALAHLSLRDLLDALLARIAEVLDADTAAIMLVDESGSALTMRAASGFHAELQQARPIPFGEGLAGTVAASRTPRLIDDLDELELVSSVLRARGIRSLIAIPLIVEDELIGIVHAGSEQRGHFSADDLRMLELIADRIALAIAQIGLVEAERDTQQRLSFLAEASTLLSSSLEYEETLVHLAALVVPPLADWCAIDMLAGDGSIQRLAVAHADPEEVRWAWEISERMPPEPDATSGVPAVLRTGEPELLPEVTAEMVAAARTEHPELAEILDRLDVHSLMTVPLIARGRALGAITFASSESGRRFGEDDLAFAQELAARAATAVDNARLFRSAEEGRERLGFLAEASALLGSALHPEDALAELGNLVTGRIADWCSIHLVDELGAPRLVTITHGDPERAADARSFAEGIEPSARATEGVGKVIRTGMPELWPEIPRELLEGPVLAAGIHSAIIVPLVARGRTLGALTLVWAETDRKYDESDLEFAEDLARRAAVAIDNAQLYRQAEERAQAARVLASVGDGVVLVDSAGIARYWNRAAEAITGLPGAIVLERPIAEVIPGWDTVAQRVPVAADPAATLRFESLPVGIGGRELWLSVSGVSVADGTVYAFRDLTEERALEELRTEFVSTVSHELRTPLAAIYGAAMTLRRSDVDLAPEQSEKLLGVVSNEADRLARTVNAILWASRLDSETLHVAIESCDALALTSDVVEAQRTHLPAGIEIGVEADEPLPRVAADRDKVGQVLVNLVENAVKYSPDGGRVRVRVGRVGASVRFAVSDEGLGIPYAEQRRIFEKFYRLDPNMTRGIGGTGLGLYICRELVRRMDGRIWVGSEPGRGSTFTFELPVAGTDAEVAAHRLA